MCAFNRPEMLRDSLNSIKANRPSTDWTCYISIEHGAPSTVAEVASVIQPCRTSSRVIYNATHRGCSLNGFLTCFTAIQHGAESILFMDDDIVLSPDALELCEWYLRRSHEGAGLALCRKDNNEPSEPNRISDRSTWMGHLGQGWFFTRRQWFDFVLRNWWAYDPGMGEHDTFDWALCYMAQKLNKIILRPQLARARHAGAIGHHGAGIGAFPDLISDGTHRDYRIE